MDTRLRKIGADLLRRPARTLITVLGLALGIWGLSTVLVARQILAVDLGENFLNTVPPHAVLSAHDVRPAAVAELKRLPGVAGVENRPWLSARLGIGGDRWLPMLLFVVDDFETMSVARVFPDFGEFPPPPGEMLIERDGRPLVRIMGGEVPNAHRGGGHGSPAPPVDAAPEGPEDGRLRVQLPGGRVVTATLAGTVHDPGQAPSRMEMMVYGYVSRATAEKWLPDGFADRILVRGIGVPDRGLGERLRSALTAAGATVHDVAMPPPDEHPHQFQLNTIVTVLLALSFFGFGLSAVLVINLVTVLLTHQVRQIGSLKAQGATTFQVMGMYLLGMLGLGLVATAIALPLAVKSGYALAHGMAAMLNFEVLTDALSWPFLLAMLLLGTTMPVFAAWHPVRRWCGLPVREALGHHGVSDGAAASAAASPVAHFGPLTFRLALRNALRKPARLLIGALTLAVGAVVFLFAMNLRASLLYTAQVEDERWDYDFRVSLAKPVTRTDVAWLDQLPFIGAYEIWAAGRLTMSEPPASGSPRFGVLAVPTGTQVFKPNMRLGRWVQAGGMPEVVASHRFTHLYPDLSVGDLIEVSVNGTPHTLRLAGIVKLFGPALLYLNTGTFESLFARAPGNGRHVFVRRAPDTERGLLEALEMVEQHFTAARMAVTGTQISQMASRIIRNHLEIIDVLLALVAFLMLLVSGLGLASVIGTSVVERNREIGVLRSIGATPGRVFQLLACEAALIGLLGWAIALALALTLSPALNEWFGAGVVEYPFDYAVSVSGLALSLAVVLVVALLATWAPWRGACRRLVRDAIAYE
ncbi:MAG: FtsX-like permease family protein [Pseudomonadota bacterium]